MGGEEQLALKLRTKDAKYGRHGLISRFFIKGDWQMGRPFMMNCKFGVLQYVLVKIIATIVVVVLQSLGKYHPEDWSWDSPAIYMVILINVRWVPSSSLNLSSWQSFIIFCVFQHCTRNVLFGQAVLCNQGWFEGMESFVEVPLHQGNCEFLIPHEGLSSNDFHNCSTCWLCATSWTLIILCNNLDWSDIFSILPGFRSSLRFGKASLFRCFTILACLAKLVVGTPSMFQMDFR